MGTASTSDELETLSITNAKDVHFVGDLNLANALTQSAGSGTTTFDGIVNVGSASLAGTAFALNTDFVSGGATSIAHSGLLSKNNVGNITSAGAFSSTDTGGTGTASLGANITTTNANADISLGNTTLTQSVALNTSNGNISTGTLDGTSAYSQNLDLTAGTGNISFTGVVGGAAGATRLGDLTIHSAKDVNAAQNVSAKTLTHNSGTGNAIFHGIDTTGAGDTAGGNISIITAGAIDVSGGNLTTTGGNATVAGRMPATSP